MAQPESQAPSDDVHKFLLHAEKLMKSAQFLVDAIPNVDRAEAEQAIGQVSAVYAIFVELDDPFLNADNLSTTMEYILSVHSALETFINEPEPNSNAHIPCAALSSTGGRPKYVLDLDCALELHAMGGSWKAVAQVFGCTQQTLDNHFKRAGITQTA